MGGISLEQAQIVVGFVQAIATMFAAYIAVSAAFAQLQKQFEHKIINSGWQSFQGRLFNFSSALVEYVSGVQSIPLFLLSQDNSFRSKEKKLKDRESTEMSLKQKYFALREAYILFLRSFENHEVIFLSLMQMQKTFDDEYHSRVIEKHEALLELIFPETHGVNSKLSTEDTQKVVSNYCEQMLELLAFLDDFRVELQNETVGIILRKRVPKRIPNTGYKVLTKSGFIVSG